MVNFPTTIDTLTNPVWTNAVATVDHSLQHRNVNDIVEALEAKVGVDSSAITDSLDYKVAQNTAKVKATWAEVDTGTDDAKFATAKALADSKNVPSVAPWTSGNVLTSDGTDWVSEAPSGGGTSLWTAITATKVSGTTATVVGDQTAIFKKGMIVRWTESSVDKVAMVSIPSTVSTNTTITFIGDTMASVTDFKYSVILGAEQFKEKFAYAGTVGAVLSDVMNAYYATEPMKVIGADLQSGTAGVGTTTTIDINKAGTTMFTTKPVLATTVASSPLPFTADTTSALALGDRVSVDVDVINTTTLSIDLYVQLFLFPTRFLTLE